VELLGLEAEELRDMAKMSHANDEPVLEKEYQRILHAWEAAERSLYLHGKYDLGSAYVTISSGAGGTDAQDWAAMLLRMYLRYSERREWKTEIIEQTHGQEAGMKSVTFHVTGDAPYGHLQCERGTHRLVRISPFGAKGIRQTSFALVEVLPDMSEYQNELDIKPEDLRIDTYRSGGAGGQHVNKTDSAVRMTHIPTGIVVACQNERSQLQNRERALQMLKSKLLQKRHDEEEAERKRLKGSHVSADFGSQIRSYVLHPYQMVKDLRTNVETSDTSGVLDGDLDPFVEAELKRLALEGEK